MTPEREKEIRHWVGVYIGDEQYRQLVRDCLVEIDRLRARHTKVRSVIETHLVGRTRQILIDALEGNP